MYSCDSDYHPVWPDALVRVNQVRVNQAIPLPGDVRHGYSRLDVSNASKRLRKRLRLLEQSPVCKLCEIPLDLENACRQRLAGYVEKQLICIACSRGFNRKSRNGRLSRFSRIRLDFVKKDPHCYYCRKQVSFEGSSLDHLVPRSRGGGNDIENLVLACLSCNLEKADLNAEEYLAIRSALQNVVVELLP